MPKNYKPDFTAIGESNPELQDYLNQSLNRPQTPYGVVAEAYPGLAELYDALMQGIPTGAAGLFHGGFKHAKIDTGGDDVLAGFEPEVLAAMPRVSGPGQVQVADSHGRQHDAFDVQQRVDRLKGIVYSQAADPATVNKLMGG